MDRQGKNNFFMKTTRSNGSQKKWSTSSSKSLETTKRILALRISLLGEEVFCGHFNHQEMKIFGVEYDFRGTRHHWRPVEHYFCKKRDFWSLAPFGGSTGRHKNYFVRNLKICSFPTPNSRGLTKYYLQAALKRLECQNS